ncbi:MAG: dual CXXC motif small (seleno)protein [Thermodesulfobacteriota bacterium]
MKCKKCGGQLEIARACRRVRMRCRECRNEYQIHEVADQLDPETEERLSYYTSIIYD